MHEKSESNRIATIDVLRGWALLGILVMNIQAFALPTATYFNPQVYGGFSETDRLAWFATRLLFDVKFLSIFSMLFGASLVLAADGPREKRRLGSLWVFGLVHGYLIFIGDILFTYATVGFLILAARGWSIERQARTGMGLLIVAPLSLAALGFSYDWLPKSWHSEITRTITDIDVAQELLVFRSEYLKQLQLRAELSFSNQVFGTLFESGWQAAGCMLLGMAGVQSKFFEGRTRIHRHSMTFFMVGLLITAAGMSVALSGRFTPKAWLYGQALHLIGSAGVAFGWVAFLIRLAQASALQGLISRVGRLGKVAFSAYIIQSLAGLLVFGGSGLGQYGQWSRTQLFLAPFGFWAVQVLLAGFWTSCFRVGPLEALWRGIYRGDFSLGRIRTVEPPEE